MWTLLGTPGRGKPGSKKTEQLVYDTPAGSGSRLVAEDRKVAVLGAEDMGQLPGVQEAQEDADRSRCSPCRVLGAAWTLQLDLKLA